MSAPLSFSSMEELLAFARSHEAPTAPEAEGAGSIQPPADAGAPNAAAGDGTGRADGAGPVADAMPGLAALVAAPSSWDPAAPTAEEEEYTAALKDLVGDDPGAEGDGDGNGDKGALMIEAFATAIVQNKFDLRGVIGSKWASVKSKDKTLAAEYEALKPQGRDAQAAFRMDWCRKTYKKLKEERSKTQELQEVDEMDGVYMPFSVIVREEGGDAPAMQAARNYVAECVRHYKVGKGVKTRSFLSFNTWTKRVEFLYIKKRFRQSFAKKWAHKIIEVDPSREAEVNKVVNGDSVVGATPAQVAELAKQGTGQTARVTAPEATSGQAVGKGEGKGKGSKSKRKGSGKGGSGKSKKPKTTHAQADDEPEPDQKDEIAEKMAQLKPLKAKLGLVTSRCTDFLEAVSSNAKYEWANNEFQLKQLRTARSKLDALKGGSDFWNEWVMDDDFLKKAMKKYTKATIEVELKNTAAVTAAINGLQHEVSTLKDMHAARTKREQAQGPE